MSKDNTEDFEEVAWPGESFLEAAKLDCLAKIKQAEAKISLYLEHPVGIGDHPNIMEEIVAAAEAGAHAQDILSFLEARW
tara:strand:- start:15561 stop:15800 length:240 start_codon:yes stop_codon:yes gene_type:complete